MDPPPPPPPATPPPSITSDPTPSQPPSSTEQPPLQPQQQQIPNPDLHTNYSQPQQPNNMGVPFSGPPWSHLTPQFHSSASPSPTTIITTSAATSPLQKGGIAIGTPAHHPTPTSTPSSGPPAAFSSSFGVQYGGALPRTPVTLPDHSASPSSSPSPARPTMQGVPSMGMLGSQIRPGGVPPSALHQQRPIQMSSGIRPQTTSNSSVPQNCQGHGMLRPSSVTPSSSTPSTSQSLQPSHQPWLAAPQGRPPLPSQSFRPQVNSQSLQHRSHILQQSTHSVSATPQALPQQSLSSPQQQQLMPRSQQQHLMPSSQQQQYFQASNQSQDNYGHQLSSSRISQPLANQQQIVRVQGSANQKLPSPMGQAIVHSGPTDHTNAVEIFKPCTILSKRSIQELVNQIDPSEKLDPDVEDVLVDIAEDFIDSVTTFGCSIAKHRKSNTLEAKDILLHLERTWNMTLPGFTGDEIKTNKKPVVNDIHKARLALIKKSLAGADNKSSAIPATANVKGNLAKATPNVVGS